MLVWMTAVWGVLAGVCLAPAGAQDSGRVPPPEGEATPVASETPGDAAPLDVGEAPAVSTHPASPTAPPPVLSRAAALQTIPTGGQVAIIRVEGAIYDFTFESMQRRVGRALADGATVIVFELDTPGGMVTSAIDICKYIKHLPVPTIAWINNQAYSAGTMIASACDVIIMSGSSSFGDSAPITMTQDMAPTERAKALSPVLGEYRDNAQQNGYDYAPFHAMCVLGSEVYYVENIDTGQRRLVNQVDFDIMVNGLSLSEAEEKYDIPDSTPDAELARVGRPTGTALPADVGRWRPVTALPSGATLPNGRVHDGSTLYTLSQTEAMDLGLAAAVASNPAEVRQLLGAARVFPVNQTWSESLAGFLTNPFVRGVLVLLLLVGAYIEFQAPGVGLPGAVAAIALVALIAAPFVVGLAEVWHIFVILIGVALLLVELIATPTFGLMGIVGVFMIIAGLALAVVPTSGGGPMPLPAPGTWDQLFTSTLVTLLSFLLGLVAIIVLTNYYGSIPLLSRLVLDGGGPATPAPGQPVAPVSGDHALGDGNIKVGDAGTVTRTGLRPSGRVRLGDAVVDAVSQGQFIDPDTPVRVIEVHGNRIVVDPVDQP